MREERQRDEETRELSIERQEITGPNLNANTIGTLIVGPSSDDPTQGRTPSQQSDAILKELARVLFCILTVVVIVGLVGILLVDLASTPPGEKIDLIKEYAYLGVLIPLTYSPVLLLTGQAAQVALFLRNELLDFVGPSASGFSFLLLITLLLWLITSDEELRKTLNDILKILFGSILGAVTSFRWTTHVSQETP